MTFNIDIEGSRYYYALCVEDVNIETQEIKISKEELKDFILKIIRYEDGLITFEDI